MPDLDNNYQSCMECSYPWSAKKLIKMGSKK